MEVATGNLLATVNPAVRKSQRRELSWRGLHHREAPILKKWELLSRDSQGETFSGDLATDLCLPSRFGVHTSAKAEMSPPIRVCLRIVAPLVNSAGFLAGQSGIDYQPGDREHILQFPAFG